MLLHTGVQFMLSAKCCTLTCNEAPPVLSAKLSKRRETMSMANRWLFSELWLMRVSALRRARREKSACVTLQETWRRWGGREWGRDWEFVKLTAELGEGGWGNRNEGGDTGETEGGGSCPRKTATLQKIVKVACEVGGEGGRAGLV